MANLGISASRGNDTDLLTSFLYVKIVGKRRIEVISVSLCDTPTESPKGVDKLEEVIPLQKNSGAGHTQPADEKKAALDWLKPKNQDSLWALVDLYGWSGAFAEW